MYCNLKIHRPLLSLYFSIIDFKTLFLLLEVGMRFKACTMEVILMIVLVRKYINYENCDYFMLLLRGNLFNPFLWLRNSTYRGKSRTFNYGNDETQTQKT